MDLRFRQFLIALVCSVVAVCAGWQIAQGELFSFDLAGLVTAGALLLSLGAISVRLLGLPIDVIVLGWLLFGYIVGNRGFAQLMPSPGIPLLPAEAGLLLIGGWRVVSWAFTRRAVFRNTPLDWALALWLVAGFTRLLFDFPEHGFVALRDSALVYYALYFFLAQDIARDPAAVRYLAFCTIGACLMLGPVALIDRLAPDFFLRYLAVHGIPIIHQKGDLIYTFCAVGAVFTFFVSQGKLRLLAVPLSAAMFLYAAGGDNRASLVGLMFATGLLLGAGRWRFAMAQGAAAALALLVLAGLALVADNVWATRRLDGLRDRFISLTDYSGTRAYSGIESSVKGDNNRFRLIWWRNVAEETWAENPAFGRGFGADLAVAFLQEYYPEGGEEFSARSPHNVFLTVFGRMGLVGLAIWLSVCLLLARRGWQNLRRTDDPVAWCFWSALAIMIVSASFGVVLEGPMGAVPFWIFAGAGCGWQRSAVLDARAAEIEREPQPALAPAAPAGLVRG